MAQAQAKNANENDNDHPDYITYNTNYHPTNYPNYNQHNNHPNYNQHNNHPDYNPYNDAINKSSKSLPPNVRTRGH